MVRRLDAVYSRTAGGFLPIGKVDLPDNAHVTMILLTDEDRPEHDTLCLTAGKDLRDLFGCLAPGDAAVMQQAIEDAFEKPDSDAWQ